MVNYSILSLFTLFTCIQAQALEKHLDSEEKKIGHAIYVEVEENILLERLTGRTVCSSCGETFHRISNPPKVINRCDSSNEILIQREDDREETVKERLRVNYELTNQLVNYYGKRGIIKFINGTKNITEVTRDILSIFK